MRIKRRENDPGKKGMEEKMYAKTLRERTSGKYREMRVEDDIKGHQNVQVMKGERKH